MKNIKIVITGASKTGKSAIAFAIGVMLKEAGIDSVLYGEDSNLLTVANTYIKRLESIKDKTKVEIEMINTND